MNNVDPAKAAELQEKLKSMSPEEIAAYQKSNCVFCKVISGEVEGKKLYSDDKVYVILDINPANDGHVLILPKEHYPIMPLVPKEIIDSMAVKAREFSTLFLKTLGVKGSTMFIANGAAAGQKAQHFMIHLIPRNDGDGLDFKLPKEPVNVDEMMSKLNPMFKRAPTVKHEKHVEAKPSELVEDDEISAEEEGFMSGEEKAEEITDAKKVSVGFDDSKKSKKVDEEDDIIEMLGGKKKSAKKVEDDDEIKKNIVQDKDNENDDSDELDEDVREMEDKESHDKDDSDELDEEDRETQEEIDEEKEDEQDDRHDKKSDEIDLDEIGGLFK